MIFAKQWENITLSVMTMFVRSKWRDSVTYLKHIFILCPGKAYYRALGTRCCINWWPRSKHNGHGRRGRNNCIRNTTACRLKKNNRCESLTFNTHVTFWIYRYCSHDSPAVPCTFNPGASLDTSFGNISHSCLLSNTLFSSYDTVCNRCKAIRSYCLLYLSTVFLCVEALYTYRYLSSYSWVLKSTLKT